MEVQKLTTKYNIKEFHMNTLNTYKVYTMTPKGGFSLKYEGTEEVEALKAYDKLESKNLPRQLGRREGQIYRTVMSGGGFPQD